MSDRIQAGCEDCDVVTDHHTVTAAAAAIIAHVAATLHRPLIATPRNGWHRYWIE